MPFLGSTPAEQYQSLAKQTITGDGSTAYTLNRSVTNAYDMEVFINNTRQEPDTSYSAAGNTITFTAAVTSSDSCYIIYQGQSVGSINPPAGSVGGTQIQNTSVTNAHLAGAITDAKLHSSLDLSSKTLTMPAGHVIQVQHAYSNTQVISSTAGAAIDGVSLSFTPKYNNSKLLIQARIPIKVYNTSTDGDGWCSIRIVNSTSAIEPEPNNNYEFGANFGNTSWADWRNVGFIQAYHTVTSTNADTYKVQAKLYSANETLTVNENSLYYSSITIMEIAQ